MSVLVTGAGLIGQQTADLLVARGEPVVLADIRVPDSPATPLMSLVRCDVTNADEVRAIIAAHGVTAIVHTAALLSTGIRQDPLRGVAVNVMGTANILDAARTHGLRRVVVASSTTVGYTAFGRHGATPIEEDLALRMIGERPASLYAMTKIASEQLALLYGDLYGSSVVVLRYGAVLGGSLTAPTSVPGRLLARLAAAAGSGARMVVDDPFLVWGGIEEFVDARDCARANLCALDAEAPVQRVYNVATGEAYDMPAFLAVARRVFPGLDVEAPPASQTGFAGFPYLRPAPSCTAAAERELGFRSRYGLDDSLRFWGSPHDGAGQSAFEDTRRGAHNDDAS